MEWTAEAQGNEKTCQGHVVEVETEADMSGRRGSPGWVVCIPRRAEGGCLAYPWSQVRGRVCCGAILPAMTSEL